MASGSATIFHCPTCGEDIVGFGRFGAHRQAHRRAERGGAPPPKRPRVRQSKRRIEDVQTAPDPTVGDAPGPDPDPQAEVRGPSLDQPTIRVTPEQRQASVADVVRDALPISTLADLVHAISVAVSEADGAGEAGYLSKIQSVQVASLLHEPTVQFVIERFGGDVNRFKAGLAVILILIGKGGVHARAIRARIGERRERIASPAVAAEIIAATTANGTHPVDRAPQPAGLGDAMARQRDAFAGTPGNAE
jgi:hypothetical protein